MMTIQRNTSSRLFWSAVVLTGLLVALAGCEDGQVVDLGSNETQEYSAIVDISTDMLTQRTPGGDVSTLVRVDITARDPLEHPGGSFPVESIKLDGEYAELTVENSRGEKIYPRAFTPDDSIACEIKFANGVNFAFQIHGMDPFQLAGWEDDTLRCGDTVDFSIVDLGSFSRLYYDFGSENLRSENHGYLAAEGDVSLPLPYYVGDLSTISFSSRAYFGSTNSVTFNDTLYQDSQIQMYGSRMILKRQ